MLKRLGYFYFNEEGVSGRAGVSILTKHKAQEVNTTLPFLRSRYKEIFLPQLNLRVVSFYAPLGMTYVKSRVIDDVTDPRYDPEVMRNKLLFLRFLRERFLLGKERSHKLLMCGDYNVIRSIGDAHFVTTQAQMDRRASKVMTSLEERAVVQEIANNSASLEADGFTFFDYRLNCLQKNLGLKIDSV